MTDCTHRQLRLIISMPDYTYQIQCAACLLTGDTAPTGMRAYAEWARLMRAERLDRAA